MKERLRILGHLIIAFFVLLFNREFWDHQGIRDLWEIAIEEATNKNTTHTWATFVNHLSDRRPTQIQVTPTEERWWTKEDTITLLHCHGVNILSFRERTKQNLYNTDLAALIEFLAAKTEHPYLNPLESQLEFFVMDEETRLEIIKEQGLEKELEELRARPELREDLRRFCNALNRDIKADLEEKQRTGRDPYPNWRAS